MSILEKLLSVQQNLKAPKGQFNSFGKYKYRSCEDILMAVKPLLASTKCVLTMEDEIIAIADRIYVKSIGTLTDTETGEKITSTGYAREASEIKGLSASQITGVSVSYSRKYMLNGLFAIDDTKDADTNEFVNQTAKEVYTKNEDGVTMVRSMKKNEKDTWFAIADMTEKQLEYVISVDAYGPVHEEVKMLLKERFGIEL